MATLTSIENALANSVQTITTERQAAKNAKARLITAHANIEALNTLYAEEMAYVASLDDSSAFNQLYKDKLAKLQEEGLAILVALDTANAALSAITEF